MSTLEVTAEEYYQVVADENYEKGVEEGMEKGISHTVHLLRSIDLDDDTICSKIMAEFNLTKDEVSKYL